MKDYPAKYKEYVKLMQSLGNEIPETMQAFNQLHQVSTQDSALSKKTKELIALGIAICVRCDGCITFHVHDALRAGANQAEIVETIGTAIMMGGGPSVIYGCEALEALQQFAVTEVVIKTPDTSAS